MHRFRQVDDTVLLNGRIVTLDQKSTIADALAVRDGRVAFVGSNGEARRWIGAQTRAVDLGGRTVIPGLIDSHIHGLRGGLTFTTELEWTGVAALEGGLEIIREAAARSAPGTWLIVAGGWHRNQFEERRGPTPEELHEAAPDHPVYVQHQYDSAVFNRAGLAALGIDGATADPPKGRYERDEAGRPTGRVIGDVPTFFSVFDMIPKPTYAQQVDGLRTFFRRLNKLGLTGIIDPAGGGLYPQHYTPLFQLWQEGDLTVRVSYYINSQVRGGELADLAHATSYLHMGMGDDMLRFLGLGEIVIWSVHDGDDYSLVFDMPATGKEDLYQIARLAARRGFSLQIHATSDHTGRQILDVFERVDSELPIHRLRWVIAHMEDLTEETMLRMKALGVVWATQNRLYFSGERYLEAKGEAVTRRAPPLRTGMKHGLAIAAGTDAHRVSPFNPFISLWWYLTGKTVRGDALRDASETPTREEALRLYTLGSAWMAHAEQVRGSLEVGKYADLAVLNKDYLTVPVDEIKDLESVLTMVGGRVVYAGGGFDLTEQ